MSLTHQEVLEILKLVEEADYDDVRVEIGDVKIHVRKRGGSEAPAATVSTVGLDTPRALAAPGPGPASSAAPAVASTRTGARKHDVEDGLIAIRAPMLGTFYRAPAPGEKTFTEVGARVQADDTVCLIEVMKLFNSVKAGVTGTVISIDAENGGVVEYDQVLLTIRPD